MQQQIKEQFWAYIIEYNPELMFQLQENYSVRKFLNDQVGSIMPLVMGRKAEGGDEATILQEAMEVLTEPLRPSRYQYLKQLIAAYFPIEADNLSEQGILTYVLVQLLEKLVTQLTELDLLSTTSRDANLEAQVIEQIHEYLKNHQLIGQE